MDDPELAVMRQWQPLDMMVFGELKGRSRTLFNELMLIRAMRDMDILDAVKILCFSWSSVKEETIRNAWKRLTD